MAKVEPPTLDELQDLIDGRLSGRRLQEIHEYLARDNDMARMVQNMRQTDVELRRFGRELLLAGRSRDSPRAGGGSGSAFMSWTPGQGAGKSRLAGIALACGACVAVGLGAGWWARMGYDDPHGQMVNDFLGDVAQTYAYIQSAEASSLDFTADQQSDWVQWSAETYGAEIEAPNLEDHGYKYVGARVVPRSASTGSVLTYRNGDDTTITIYFWRSESVPDGLPQQASLNGYRMNVHSQSEIVLAVVGPADVDGFDGTVEAVHQAFAESKQGK